MSYRNRDLTETELDYHREVFRRSSLGCKGYTVGVCAALLCIVSDYTGKTPDEIGGLTGQQLWKLAGAGFVATLKISELPVHVDDYLTMGERFAIKLGLSLSLVDIPTGECLGEIYKFCGVDVGRLNDLLFGEQALHSNTLSCE